MGIPQNLITLLRIIVTETSTVHIPCFPNIQVRFNYFSILTTWKFAILLAQNARSTKLVGDHVINCISLIPSFMCV